MYMSWRKEQQQPRSLPTAPTVLSALSTSLPWPACVRAAQLAGTRGVTTQKLSALHLHSVRAERERERESERERAQKLRERGALECFLGCFRCSCCCCCCGCNLGALLAATPMLTPAPAVNVGSIGNGVGASASLIGPSFPCRELGSATQKSANIA